MVVLAPHGPLYLSILCLLGATVGQDIFLANKIQPPEPSAVGLKIINNCNEDIDLRTPRMDLPGDDDSDGNYETIAAHQEKDFAPGTVKGMKVVLAWKDAAHTPCYNGVFCTQVELSITNETFGFRTCDQPNFVNQLAFNDMQIGAAFFKGSAPHAECPQSLVEKCRENATWCKNRRGKFDKCMHEAWWCDLVGWNVKLSPESTHQYCLSPDVNKAVISWDMENPTPTNCSSAMDPERWLCEGICKDLTHTETGTTNTLCGPRWDMVYNLKHGLTLFTSDDIKMAPEDFIRHNKFGGAKPYQTAVNRACGNQPPSQRAKSAPNGTIIQGWAPEYDRNYEEKGHLDHAITYEGDDVNMFQLKHQKFQDRGLFMAGSVGMVCHFPDVWDTFVIKACPTQDD